MGRVTSQQVYFLSRGTKNDHSFLKEVFYTKRGIFLYNSTNFDKKKGKVPYFTHNEIISNHNKMQYYVHCIHQWGGNLCKYTYHLLLINATFIQNIHKYSKNTPFFVQFLYVFVPKLAKNCTKLAIFVPKLYKN